MYQTGVSALSNYKLYLIAIRFLSVSSYLRLLSLKLLYTCLLPRYYYSRFKSVGTYRGTNKTSHKIVERHGEHCQRGFKKGATLFWTNLLPVSDQPCYQGRLTAKVSIKTARRNDWFTPQFTAAFTVMETPWLPYDRLVPCRHLGCHAIICTAMCLPQLPCICLNCHVLALTTMFMPQLPCNFPSWHVIASSAMYLLI